MPVAKTESRANSVSWTGVGRVDNQVMYAVAGVRPLQRKLELRNEHQRTKFFGNDIRLDG